MQVADLVQDDWGVDDASPVNLVKLLNSVILIEVEAEDSVKLLTVLAQTTDHENLGGRDFHRGKSADGQRNH